MLYLGKKRGGRGRERSKKKVPYTAHQISRLVFNYCQGNCSDSFKGDFDDSLDNPKKSTVR